LTEKNFSRIFGADAPSPAPISYAYAFVGAGNYPITLNDVVIIGITGLFDGNKFYGGTQIGEWHT